MRVCKFCQGEYPLECFANAGTVNGVLYRRHVCKPCYYKSKMVRRDDLKVEWDEYIATLSCDQCGESHPATLQFHHVEQGQKEITISDARRKHWSMKSLRAEIGKCRVLCANCHFILHWEERRAKVLR